MRQCSSCHSSGLNYIDTCPECASIAIPPQNSFHCFNCGHVA
ncbi:MAG: hypothetical protein KAH18_06245 [Psychromonas sp.]|nr:hypothetical protein [Psychromonas sp.]